MQQGFSFNLFKKNKMGDDNSSPFNCFFCKVVLLSGLVNLFSNSFLMNVF